MMFMKKNKKGFTLIELIIVITVLAILAVVAVPVVSNVITNANNSVDQANVALFQSSMERYTVNKIADEAPSGLGNYPATLAAAQLAIKTFTNLKTIPAPKAGGNFYYVTTAFSDTGVTPTVDRVVGEVFSSKTVFTENCVKLN
jgi:prepilin-type N-terminal cleavage/methylation domain-containing protein